MLNYSQAFITVYGGRYTIGVSMKKIGFFLKVFEKESYMCDFLDGKIYMNRLVFFRRMEEESSNNKADPAEGLSAWLQPEQVEVELNGYKLTDFAAPIEIRQVNNDYLHVFCLFAGATSNENLSDPQKIKQVETDFAVSPECANLGNHYVLVHNTKEFINRMVSAIRGKGFKGNAGLVNYYDPKTFSGDFGDRSAFNKPHNYAHQKEYRFAVNTYTSGEDPLVLELGDIRDIACVSNTWDIKVGMKFGSEEKIV